MSSKLKIKSKKWKFPLTQNNQAAQAFDRMIKERRRRGKDTKWSCGEEVYLWWMQDNNVVGQMELSDFIEY